MVATIVLSQSNVVPNSNNNQLIYKFPNSVQFPHHEIAVQQVSMFYSWQNINNTTLSNNTFQYIFYGSAGATVRTVAIPSGLYQIADINSYLQFVMISNGDYLTNASGQNVYYLEMVVNPTLYAIQLNVYPIPTSLPAGYTGSFSLGFPLTTQDPQFIFPSNFNEIVGYPSGYQSPAGTTIQSFLSPLAPEVQPNPTIFVSMSNILNPYALPSSIIYAINPTVAFGEQINSSPPQYSWNKLMPGTYQELRVGLLGSNYAPINILDPNMTIIVVIRDTQDLGIQQLITQATGGK